MTQEIFDRAEILLGSEAKARGTLEAMCAAAGEELRRRLKDGLQPTEIRELFVSAAGVLALSMYIQIGDLDEVSSMKVGNISVSRRGAGAARASATALRRQAENMLAAYLVDTDFSFRGVRG